MDRLIIIGTGMNARHAYDFINYYHLFEVVGFAVHKAYITTPTFCGKPVYEIEQLSVANPNKEIKLFVAVFWNRLNADRRFLYENLKAQGYQFANIVSPKAIVHGELLGDNCWIHDYVIINSFAKIGNNVMVMANAFIGQDSIIEDHCFCAARCLIASCHVGEQSFIGLNAVLFDGVSIGKKCIIGATCSVKRSMADYSLVKSSNDNFIIKLYDENSIEQKLLAARNIR